MLVLGVHQALVRCRLHNLLYQAKVCKLGVPGGVKQDILQLQVPVDDLGGSGVEVMEPAADVMHPSEAVCVAVTLLVCHGLVDQRAQVAAGDSLHGHEHQLCARLGVQPRSRAHTSNDAAVVQLGEQLHLHPEVILGLGREPGVSGRFSGLG